MFKKNKTIEEEIKRLKKASPERKQINREMPIEKQIDHKPCLEEYTLGLVLTYPKILKTNKKELLSLFVKPEIKEILKSSKKHSVQLDHLIFKTEIQKGLSDEFDPKKEIEFCLSQLKKRKIQHNLNVLTVAIKEAEVKKDKNSLKKLTRDFNKISKQMNFD